jgi:hypothetical protein
MVSENNYNVVFQYTRECGGYEGVMTWTAFKDKADFEKWYTPEIKKRNEAIAQGVTSEEAIKICDRTPLSCSLAACVEEAKDKRSGKVDKQILKMELDVLSARRFIQFNPDEKSP